MSFKNLGFGFLFAFVLISLQGCDVGSSSTISGYIVKITDTQFGYAKIDVRVDCHNQNCDIVSLYFLDSPKDDSFKGAKHSRLYYQLDSIQSYGKKAYFQCDDKLFFNTVTWTYSGF